MNASITTHCIAVPSGGTALVVSEAALTAAKGIGGSAIVVWILVALCGMACTQTFNYFMEYRQDSPGLKTFVIILWGIGTAHAALACHVIYFYTVTCAFNPTCIAHNDWSNSATITCHIIITILVFAYFIRLAVQLSGTKLHFSFAIGLAIPVIGFAISGLGSVTRMAMVPLRANVRMAAEPWTTAMAVMQVVVDILLSTVVCVLLNKQKSVFKSTGVVIKVLLLFAIGRGIINAIGELVILFGVTIDPVASWPNAAGHVVAQLYINSLLITLNARKILRVTDGRTADCSEKVAVPLSHGLHDRCSKLPSDSASQMEAGSAKAMSFTGIGTHASVIDISLETDR